MTEAMEPANPGYPVLDVRIISDETQNKPVKVREVVTNFGRRRFAGDNSQDENPSAGANPGQVGRQVLQLLNKVPGRRRTIITVSELDPGTSNPANTVVYLGRSRSQVQDGSCFHIPPGTQLIELHGTDEIWCGMAFGAKGVVAYAAELGE